MSSLCNAVLSIRNQENDGSPGCASRMNSGSNPVRLLPERSSVVSCLIWLQKVDQSQHNNNHIGITSVAVDQTARLH